MANVDTRQVQRDSFFLLAHVRVDGRDESHRVKVRNLSAGGMMAEGDVKVSRGEMVHVELRNIGSVGGSVAWKQGTRFGIAFIEEIDPKLARAPLSADPDDHNIPTRYKSLPTGEAQPVEKEKLRNL